MKNSFSYKLVLRLLTVLIVLCLEACHEDFALLDDSGAIVGNGMLKSTMNYPSPVLLTLDGKKYTGLWNAERIYEKSLAESRRMISEHALLAYEVGNDPHQLRHGQASLATNDGSKIQCNFYYRTQPSMGICDIDGKKLKLKVKEL